MKIRSYSELKSFSTFEERFQYLKLSGIVGKSTFGFERFLNQNFYNSREWKQTREKIIIRDNACDLAIPSYDLFGFIRIHHMNPISMEDIECGNPDVFNPEFLICTSLDTHNAIHFGSAVNVILPKERRKGDTIPWKAF